MKRILQIVILLLSTWTAKADYDPLRLFELILGADRIVYGEITSMDSLSYTLEIQGNLTGDQEVVEVLRFQDWPCAWRWTNYKVGQRLFLFLRKHNGKFHSMSAGNEGELPLFENEVFVHGLSLNSPPAVFPDSIKEYYAKERNLLISHRYPVYDGEFFGYKANLDDFIQTVLTVRKCFTIDYGEYGSIKEVTIECTEDELEQWRRNDELLNWTFEELNKKTGGNKG